MKLLTANIIIDAANAAIKAARLIDDHLTFEELIVGICAVAHDFENEENNIALCKGLICNLLGIIEPAHIKRLIDEICLIKVTIDKADN